MEPLIPTPRPSISGSEDAGNADGVNRPREVKPIAPTPAGRVELIQTFIPRLGALGSENEINVDYRSPTTPSATSLIEGEGGQGETVLVIDDLLSIRNVFQVLLKKYGYIPIVAEDGAAGLTCYRANQNIVRIVIVDMRMPGLQGAEVIRELQMINPDVRIVAMSGHFNTLMENSVDSDRLALLQKPMTGDELQIALRRVTRVPRRAVNQTPPVAQ